MISFPRVCFSCHAYNDFRGQRALSWKDVREAQMLEAGKRHREIPMFLMQLAVSGLSRNRCLALGSLPGVDSQVQYSFSSVWRIRTNNGEFFISSSSLSIQSVKIFLYFCRLTLHLHFFSSLNCSKNI